MREPESTALRSKQPNVVAKREDKRVGKKTKERDGCALAIAERVDQNPLILQNEHVELRVARGLQFVAGEGDSDSSAEDSLRLEDFDQPPESTSTPTPSLASQEARSAMPQLAIQHQLPRTQYIYTPLQSTAPVSASSSDYQSSGGQATYNGSD